jgi:exodeoxyribonuclease V gamma subunit
MNDGDDPRTQMPMDFDLMAGRGQYRPGDRSRRDDDRYLFLEALLAAREALYISWVAHDVRDNHERPASVLVAQLRDYLSSAFSAAEGDLVKLLTVQHPLQPFSKKYFDGSDPQLFSYDQAWCAAHDLFEQHDLALTPLPPAEEAVSLNSAQLSRFLKNPAQLFFNERLKVRFSAEEGSDDDSEPFALDGLSKHHIQSTLLDTVMQAGQQEPSEIYVNVKEQLSRSGILPVGHAGEALIENLGEQVWQTLGCWQDCCKKFPTLTETKELFLPIKIDGHDFILQDWLTDLREGGPTSSVRLAVVAGELKDKHHRLLNDWSLHLLANACGHAISTLVIGSDQLITLQPLANDQAQQYLQDLLSAWLTALNGPLPLACRTGFAFVRAERAQQDSGKKANPMNKAQDAYQGNSFVAGSGEVHYGNQQALRRAFADFTALTAQRVSTSNPEQEDEPAFCHWARRLYGPLLSHCEATNHE